MIWKVLKTAIDQWFQHHSARLGAALAYYSVFSLAWEERRKGTAVVATGDRDAYQLASGLTTILQPIKAGEMATIGPAEVRGRYGVDPGQVPDFIALRGDDSDRIPGAKGIGPKTAAALLRKYGSLERTPSAGYST